MKIKFALYIIFSLLFVTSCIEEDEPLYGSDGCVMLEIGEKRPTVIDIPQTRTTVAGEWIADDIVSSTVKLLDAEGTALKTAVIEYRYTGTAWNIESGDALIQLPAEVRSIEITATMEHTYGDSDYTEGVPTRGKETMEIIQTISNVAPSGTYTITLDKWTRTSSLLEVVKLENYEKISVRENDSDIEMVVDNTSKMYKGAYYHLTAATPYVAVVSKTGAAPKTYGIDAADMAAGFKCILSLAERPASNPLRDPYSNLPIIPEYPGYIKYQDEENPAITNYYVGNGEGLKNAFTEAGTANHNTVIKLHDDIDMEGVNWVPVGGRNEGFHGTFDGNDKTIDGLVTTTYIDADHFTEKPGTGDTEADNNHGNGEDGAYYHCSGLIAYLAPDGIVKNITLKDINISITAVDENSDVIVGSIVGINQGRVENCHLIGTPTEGSTIIASGIKNNQYDFDCRAGGIVGMNHKGSQVIACSVLGKVHIEAKDNHYCMAGGIVAYNFGDIVACYTDANHFSGDENAPEYTSRDSQGITIIARTDHSSATDYGETNIGGIVAYNDKRSWATGRVLGCYTNLDQLSHFEVTNANGTKRMGALVGNDIPVTGTTTYKTEYCCWNASAGSGLKLAIGSDPNTTASGSSTHHPNIKKVGEQIGWGDASTEVSGYLNNAIATYTGNTEHPVGCEWRFYNPYTDLFQPSLHIPSSN